MLDPVPAPAPPQPPAGRRASGGAALLLIGVLLGGIGGIAGARAITSRIAIPPPSSTTAGDAAAVASVEDVVRRANAAQAEAFAAHDPTAMRSTSTAGHYDEMVGVNRELASGGVASIELVAISFDSVSVNGTTATASTSETWRTTYADGSTDQRTDANDYDLVFEDGGWKIAANTQPNNSGVTPPQPQGPTDTTVRSTSRNWSGYVATGGTVTSVTGTWIVARPDPRVPGVDATWVGVGGAGTTDLIQAGTEATVEADGTVAYDAWTETLPQATRTISLGVTAGDTVSVSLTERAAGSWLVELKNVTTGQSYSTTIRYASSRSSAEWIEEAPSVGRGIAPLDRFGAVTFTAASAVIDGTRQSLSRAGAKAVTMADGAGEPLAVPSGIGADGASFTVTRTSNPGTNFGSGGRAPGRRRG